MRASWTSRRREEAVTVAAGLSISKMSVPFSHPPLPGTGSIYMCGQTGILLHGVGVFH